MLRLVGRYILVGFALFWCGFSAMAKAHTSSVVPEVEGNLTIVGSDTLANLLTQWSDLFKRYHPAVNIQIQTLGSSSAVPALIESTAQFGAMSRKMRVSEIASFERRYGYPPTAVKVAIDAMAIFVHQDNPLSYITLNQIDDIFSRTRRCGGTTGIRYWGQLDLMGSWKKRNIQLIGRNSVSGTYGYFKHEALCGGDFRAEINEQPSSASVVQSVASTLNSIGYAGVGSQIAGVKILPILQDSEMIYPKVKNIIDGHYPLSRYLYLYVNKKPNQFLPSLEAEFIRLILSKEGQMKVENDGFVPLPSSIRQAQWQPLGIAVEDN